MTGRMLDERLGKIHFWLLFVGFHTHLPGAALAGRRGHAAPVRRLPARATASPSSTRSRRSARSCWASRCCRSSTTCARPATRPLVESDDPWGWGRSLEWATSCPPPRHNFESLPRIRSESPAFDLHHPEIAALEHDDNDEAGRRDVADAPDEGRRATPEVASPMKAETWIFAVRHASSCWFAPAYWSQQPATGPGTVALAMTFLLALMVTLYLGFHAKKMDARPEDRNDAEIADGAGELGFFPPYSWWPLWCRAVPGRDASTASPWAPGGCSSSAPVWVRSPLSGFDLRVLPRRARPLSAAAAERHDPPRRDDAGRPGCRRLRLTAHASLSLRGSPADVRSHVWSGSVRGVRTAALMASLALLAAAGLSACEASGQALSGEPGRVCDLAGDALGLAHARVPPCGWPPTSAPRRAVPVSTALQVTATGGTLQVGRPFGPLTPGSTAPSRRTAPPGRPPTGSSRPRLRHHQRGRPHRRRGAAQPLHVPHPGPHPRRADLSLRRAAAGRDGRGRDAGDRHLRRGRAGQGRVREAHDGDQRAARSAGSWHWISDHEAHWRPAAYWKAGTDVTRRRRRQQRRRRQRHLRPGEPPGASSTSATP